jgi:hypothetical protein
MEPGVEPVRVPQATQVEPRPEERVLDGIGGLLVVAEDQSGGREEAISPAGRERGEGIDIAFSRPNHQVSLHRSAHVPAAA